MASKRPYTVRRARKNLLEAIRMEVASAMQMCTRLEKHRQTPHTTYIARREAAVRDLIAAVRAEGCPNAP